MPLSELLAIIPASGSGSRFGSPKADAEIEGISFAEHIMGMLRPGGVEHIVLARYPDSPDMLSSIKRAVSEHPGFKAWLIWPVDHMFVRPATLQGLLDAFESVQDAVIRPVYEGRHGHPVIVPGWLDLNADHHDQGLAALIRDQVCTVLDVPVEDLGILRNVNYPKDMEQ